MTVRALTRKFLHAALFYEIWDAMKVTFKHMFHKPITFQYPREQRTIHVLLRAFEDDAAASLLRHGHAEEFLGARHVRPAAICEHPAVLLVP